MIVSDSEIDDVEAELLRRIRGEPGTLEEHERTRSALLSQRAAMLGLMARKGTSIEVRREIGKLFREVADIRNEAPALLNALAQQTMEPDSELVRHIAKCLRRGVRRTLDRRDVIETLERLLDLPSLDEHARAAVIDTLGEVADLQDAERLLLRSYRSEDERARLARIFAGILSRPVEIRRLSPSGFEALACRALEARDRRDGRGVRYRVTGRPGDKGIDGVGRRQGGDGVDNVELDGLVQCKNTDRVKKAELGAFIAQADTEIRKRPHTLWRCALDDVRKFFVTAAVDGDVDDLRRFARGSGVEFIDGRELLALVRKFIRADATLDGR